MGCHFLLQGIFPTQGSNPHLLHCRWILHRWVTREAQNPCHKIKTLSKQAPPNPNSNPKSPSAFTGISLNLDLSSSTKTQDKCHREAPVASLTHVCSEGQACSSQSCSLHTRVSLYSQPESSVSLEQLPSTFMKLCSVLNWRMSISFVS